MSLELVQKALGDMTEAQKASNAMHAAELTELKGRLQAAEQEIVTVRTKGGGQITVARDPIMDAIQEQSEAISSICKAKSGSVSLAVKYALGRKALTNGDGNSPSTNFNAPVQRLGGIGNDPRLATGLLSSRFVSVPVSGNTVDGMIRSEDTVLGAAYQIAEGDTKATSVLGYDKTTANIATIAHTTKRSNQVVADNPALAADIDSIMRYAVLRKLDIELQLGAGGAGEINGLVNYAAAVTETGSISERIAKTALVLRTQGFNPDTVLINVNDDFAANTVKATGTGDYLIPPQGIYFGLTPVLSVDIPANTAYVFDSNQFLLLNRQDIIVQLGFEANDFTKNLMTVLAELRAGLYCRSPNSVKKVLLS